MTPSDWKVFRNRLPEWRERYLDATTRELSKLLRDERMSPTERFWEAKERIDEEAVTLRTCLDRISRSKVALSLVLLYGHGLIEPSDLNPFSDDLKERVLSSVQDEDRSTDAAQ